MLNERNDGDDNGGGTLKARDGARENPANRIKIARSQKKKRERERKKNGWFHHIGIRVESEQATRKLDGKTSREAIQKRKQIVIERSFVDDIDHPLINRTTERQEMTFTNEAKSIRKSFF